MVVAIAIAVTSGDVRTTALVDVSRSIADATRIKRAYTVVHIVPDVIFISVGCAVTTTYPQGVNLVA
ncbi:MAG: hypothetical protein L7S02_02050, partial [Flavobacteriales bacterium]|nr:hypothetical protein [Flavobacteriales bacterium]